jgi:hypothetical protein
MTPASKTVPTLAVLALVLAAPAAVRAGDDAALSRAYARARAAAQALPRPVPAAKAVRAAAPAPVYPQLKACEAADWSRAAVLPPRRDAAGRPETGFLYGGTGLVLLTKTAAYYYHADCDICAELTKCELATGRLTSVKQAHAIDCSDLAPYAAGAVFDACAAGGR